MRNTRPVQLLGPCIGTGCCGGTDIDGVEQSDVPEEYREQIQQYFQP
jgi:hypothetical protein